jgi:hypothetical protein
MGKNFIFEEVRKVKTIFNITLFLLSKIVRSIFTELSSILNHIDMCYSMVGMQKLLKIRHLWQFKIVVYLQRCLKRAVQLSMILYWAGNTKGGSITVPLTSCLTGLD